MTRYVYIDDTLISTAVTQNAGYGALLCPSEVKSEIVNTALRRLKDEMISDDMDKNNKRTLSRGYFHAKDNSAQAKQFFANEIVMNVSGVFHYCYTSKDSCLNKKTLRSRLTESLVSIFICLVHNGEPVKIIIENGNGISKQKVEQLIDTLYCKLERSLYDQPNLPRSFPKIEVSIGDKHVPGLQVCDLILWSMNRQGDIQNRHLLKRLGHIVGVETETTFSGVLFRQGEFNIGNAHYEDRYYDYPLSTEDVHGVDGVLNAYLVIENCLRHYRKKLLPENVQHLQEDIDKLIYRLDKHSTYKHDIKKCASLFIRLFDTVPIYNEVKDVNIWTKLLSARKIAALILRDDLINSIAVKNCILCHRKTDMFKRCLLQV